MDAVFYLTEGVFQSFHMTLIGKQFFSVKSNDCEEVGATGDVNALIFHKFVLLVVECVDYQRNRSEIVPVGIRRGQG
jgi:hypothetical protein